MDDYIVGFEKESEVDQEEDDPDREDIPSGAKDKTPYQRLIIQIENCPDPIHREWFKSILRITRSVLLGFRRVLFKNLSYQEITQEVLLHVISSTLQEEKILELIAKKESPEAHGGLIRVIVTKNAYDHSNRENPREYPETEDWITDDQFRKYMQKIADGLNEKIAGERKDKEIILARLASTSHKEAAEKINKASEANVSESTVQRTLAKYYPRVELESFDKDEDEENDQWSGKKGYGLAETIVGNDISRCAPDFWIQMEQTWNSLTSDEKKAVLLRAKEGLTNGEIANELACSAATISRLFNCIEKKLKEHISSQYCHLH